MGRNGVFGAFQGFDAFGKTLEDVRIRTRTGAFLTFLSFSIILTSLVMEFVDYRRIHLEPSIVVDRSRGEKLVVDLDVTFPRVPCSLLSLDMMDLSGERIIDYTHEIMKTRLDQAGNVLETKQDKTLKGDAERAAQNRDPDYCGSCYGASPPESGCCNTCEDVRQAYVRKGWSFPNPDGIEQCVEEHWTERMEQQASEGCRISGRVKVNKVPGNIQFSHGATFMRQGAMNIAELVPYLKDRNHHDFGHVINKLSFTADVPLAEASRMAPKEQATRAKLGIADPLTGVSAHRQDDDTNNMYQYFIKVVSTNFVYLNGEEIPTNQYSVTQYERDTRTGNWPERDRHGHMLTHNNHALPGLFINYEISPMKVTHTETRQSFAHFITSACAIIGGVLTVAGLVDSFIWNTSKRIQGKEYGGFGGAGGKMM